MQYSNALWIVILGIFLVVGCGKSSSEDPGSLCEDACDAADECHDHPLSGPFSLSGCEASCRAIDDEEDNLSEACEDALMELFECVEGTNCGTLADEFEILGRLSIEDFTSRANNIAGCRVGGFWHACHEDLDLSD